MKLKNFLIGFAAACTMLVTTTTFTACSNDSASENDNFVPITPVQMTMANGDLWVLGEIQSYLEDTTTNYYWAFTYTSNNDVLSDSTGNYMYEDTSTNSRRKNITFYYETTTTGADAVADTTYTTRLMVIEFTDSNSAYVVSDAGLETSRGEIFKYDTGTLIELE